MFWVFDKIKEFFQEIFIGTIQSNLEAMFVDINDKVTFVSGEDRRIRLTKAGYDYQVVQPKVNELL